MVFGMSSKAKEAEAAEEEGPIPGDEGAAWSGQGAGLPAYTQTAEGPEHQFHVYRAQAWKEDTIVTSASKDRVLFYLQMSTTWTSAWKNTTLFEGFKGGPVVATYNKPNWTKRSHITIEYFPVRGGPATPVELKSSRYINEDHQFVLPGTSVELKWDVSPAQTKITLYEVGKKEEVAAVWQFTTWAKRKLGKLSVTQGYLDHLEIILVTALAMERHIYAKQIETAAVVASSG